MSKKTFIISNTRDNILGKIVTLFEYDEAIESEPTNSDKEYIRVEVLVDDSFYSTITDIINRYNRKEEHAIEDKPLSLKLLDAIKYSKIDLNIIDFIGGEYFCEIVVYKDTNSFTLSCNIEELLLLHLYLTMPTQININNKTLNKVGQIFKNNTKMDKYPTFKVDGNPNKLTILKTELQKAIDRDDFELASEISKKINEIENRKK